MKFNRNVKPWIKKKSPRFRGRKVLDFSIIKTQIKMGITFWWGVRPLRLKERRFTYYNRGTLKKNTCNFFFHSWTIQEKKLNISLHIEGFTFRINQSLLAYLYFLKTVSTLQLNIYCSIFSHVHIPEFQCSVESLRICISLLNYK